MVRRLHDLSSVFLTVDVPDTPCKNYTVSLTLWRRIFLIGLIQHDMIALCERLIILYGLNPVTLAAWSLSFSSAACSSGLATPRESDPTAKRRRTLETTWVSSVHKREGAKNPAAQEVKGVASPLASTWLLRQLPGCGQELLELSLCSAPQLSSLRQWHAYWVVFPSSRRTIVSFLSFQTRMPPNSSLTVSSPVVGCRRLCANPTLWLH